MKKIIFIITLLIASIPVALLASSVIPENGHNFSDAKAPIKWPLPNFSNTVIPALPNVQIAKPWPTIISYIPPTNEEETTTTEEEPTTEEVAPPVLTDLQKCIKDNYGAVLADTDGDCVPDNDEAGAVLDNCETVKNGPCDVSATYCDINNDGTTSPAEMAAGYQDDTTENGIGDACDDPDKDQVPDYIDNCPDTANPIDANGVQDESVCTDSDADGVQDNVDNCKKSYNPMQEDTDKDGVGNTCDNCRYVANADQADSNSDRVGDTCSSDKDSDGVLDVKDNCPDVANPDQLDSDHNRVGDLCTVSPASPDTNVNPTIDNNFGSGGSAYNSDGCSLSKGVPFSAGAIMIMIYFLAAIASLGLCRKKN